MIIFKRVRAKNFLSIGNSYFDYDLNKDHITLLRGSNSMGKCVDPTTIIKLRNKNTGEIIETTIGEFYDSQKSKDN
jgi:ABC-type branched-subunit amino acid transport system ATPase component